MAQGVGQTLLHEPVGREVQTRRQCLRRTGHLELDGQARGAELRSEPVELIQARRRFELTRLAATGAAPPAMRRISARASRPTASTVSNARRSVT